MPPQHVLPASLSLREHLPTAQLVGAGDLHFTDITLDSRECRPRSLFVAAQGNAGCGENFVADAAARGAVGVITAQLIPNCPLSQCIVANPRGAYSYLCQALFGHPYARLKMMGVTGTNGKTTVTWMTRAIMTRVGHRIGVLGTVEYFDGYRAEPPSLTTPDAKLLAHWQHRMVTRGTSHLAMELSSHALDQHRAAALPLDCAIVTNITHDHLDYHGDFASYRAAKARILDLVKPGGVVALHVGDAGASSLVGLVPPECRLIRYGITPDADLSAQILEESMAGTVFRVQFQGQSVNLRIRLIGRHNVENALAAMATGLTWKIPLLEMAMALEEFRPVPGRMERCAWSEAFDVFVDYAHTPDALSRSLASLRGLSSGRLICVFGAGGDRDPSKRPLLGQAAGNADLAIITSDNPRSEDPALIAGQIAQGLPAGRVEMIMELDRALAIQRAIDVARPGDVVLIAGKGHETEQIVRGERRPFDDRRIVRDYLESRKAATSIPPLSTPSLPIIQTTMVPNQAPAPVETFQRVSA